MRKTLKDVAEKSGYSVTTVSRALGGFHDVNEITRETIIRVANEIGYRPNEIARQLRSKRARTIGMVVPARLRRFEDDFFSVLLNGVRYAASKQEYDLLISSHPSEDEEMDAYYRIVGGERVDGIIIARTLRDDPRIHYLRQSGHPFAVFGRLSGSEISDFPYIDVDGQAGIQSVVEHFISYGHRHIGLILSPEHLVFTTYRLSGYQTGLNSAGLHYSPDYITTGDMTYQSGYQSAEQLLNQAPEITAIIACNDLMALGAMNYIKDRGLRVGADIAIAGFDDIPFARHTTPTLTTIRQPIFEIGERLTEMLIQLIGGASISEPRILLQPKLMIRESSGIPPQY